jgi:hypothetical protein
MATARAHASIDRPADAVWAIVSDPTGLPSWFPNVTACTLSGDVRTVTVTGGIDVDERIVTNDPDLRRFQYRIIKAPMQIDEHLSTVDVLEHGDGCLVIYAMDVSPDELGPGMQQTAEAAVAGLKQHVESR